MIEWKTLSLASHLDVLAELSNSERIYIFKHSPSCHISHIARMRLEEQWDHRITANDKVYIVDVISQKELSRLIAKRFEVYHESPQLLVVHKGECLLDLSHLDIRLQYIEEIF